MYKTIAKLVGNTERTIFSWKQQNRPIIKLLEISFTKNELENFLETMQKPYKIEFADKYFVGLYQEFSKYIVFNKGVKALFTAIQNEDVIDNIDEVILKQYKNSLLDNYDVIKYFDNKPNNELLLYIKENKKLNWNMYKDSINDSNHLWLILYFEILQLSIEKNIYDEVFGQPNKETRIQMCLVPSPPEFFGIYTNIYRIQEKYINILNDVKKAIIDNSYEYLPKYDVSNSPFMMNTKPLKDELENAINDKLYMDKDEKKHAHNKYTELEDEDIQDILDKELGKLSKK